MTLVTDEGDKVENSGSRLQKRGMVWLEKGRLTQKRTWPSVAVGSSASGSRELRVDILSVAGTLAALEGPEDLPSLQPLTALEVRRG